MLSGLDGSQLRVSKPLSYDASCCDAASRALGWDRHHGLLHLFGIQRSDSWCSYQAAACAFVRCCETI